MDQINKMVYSRIFKGSLVKMRAGHNWARVVVTVLLKVESYLTLTCHKVLLQLPVLTSM